jgi:hypothetical protein
MATVRVPQLKQQVTLSLSLSLSDLSLSLSLSLSWISTHVMHRKFYTYQWYQSII